MGTPEGIQWIRQLREAASGAKRRKLQLLLEASILTFLRNCTTVLDTSTDWKTYPGWLRTRTSVIPSEEPVRAAIQSIISMFSGLPRYLR